VSIKARNIVIAASGSEAGECEQKALSPMLLATLPMKIGRTFNEGMRYRTRHDSRA
jgi:hypothetical protein